MSSPPNSSDAPVAAAPSAPTAPTTAPTDFNQFIPSGYVMEGAYQQLSPTASSSSASSSSLSSASSSSSSSSSSGSFCGVRNALCVHVLHLTLLAWLLLMFIAACVSFNSELHHITLQSSGGVTLAFYQAYYTEGSSSTTYANDSNLSKCEYAGRALVAVMVFSFLVLLLWFPLTVIRMSGKHVHHFITAWSIYIELFFSVFVAVMFFLGIVIWGANCVSQTVDVFGKSSSNYTLAPTGYAFIDFAALLSVASLVQLFIIRHNPFFVSYGRSEGAATAPLLG